LNRIDIGRFMRRRTTVYGFLTVLSMVGLVLVTVKDAGRKSDQGLAYHGISSGNIFNTGALPGEFSMGPVSEKFL
jgi:hypothetical protein